MVVDLSNGEIDVRRLDDLRNVSPVFIEVGELVTGGWCYGESAMLGRIAVAVSWAQA